MVQSAGGTAAYDSIVLMGGGSGLVQPWVGVGRLFSATQWLLSLKEKWL